MNLFFQKSKNMLLLVSKLKEILIAHPLVKILEENLPLFRQLDTLSKILKIFILAPKLKEEM